LSWGKLVGGKGRVTDEGGIAAVDLPVAYCRWQLEAANVNKPIAKKTKLRCREISESGLFGILL
jgi:hypothetical protein